MFIKSINYKLHSILQLCVLLFLSLSSCGSENVGSLESKEEFLSDIQGVYQTTLNVGDVGYNTRVLIRNWMGDQSDVEQYIKEHFSGQYEGPDSNPPTEFVGNIIEVYIQIADSKQHFIYRLPSQILTEFTIDSIPWINVSNSYFYINEEEFFASEIHFRKNGKFTLDKIVLWKTGFAIPLFKKKHHIRNFQKVF